MGEGGQVSGNRMDGTFHGPFVQAGEIHGDVHFHAAASPMPEPPVQPPEDWTELPDLPSAIRYLLRAQIQVAQDLPYRLPGARRPSLATVYVRQDLGTGTDETTEQTRPEPILDSRGQLVDAPNPPVARVAVRPPSRTVRVALDGDSHLLVTGGPGQGKSTLSLRLAADVAAQWTTCDPASAPLAEPVVPLRLTARELASRLALPFPEAVAQSVFAEYGALLAEPVHPAVLRSRISGCRWLLLVDGLDEVADSAVRDKLVGILASWASDADSPYRIVLTTRPIEGAALAPLQRIGAARYELQPFDDEALRSFAVHWFESAELGERFVRQIRAAHLDELARVPLLATIAAIIFEQHGDRPLPDNQYSLYEAYLKYLRAAHSTEPGPLDQACGPLLEHLGLVRLEADTSLVAATLEWAAQHLPDVEGEDLVGYLAAVGPVTRRGDDLRFLHHSFAEHLAATAKARLLPDEFDPEHTDFARLLHAARPEERGRYARAVLLHYTRLRAAQADALITWLRSDNAEGHLLAARLLAWHVPASAEVVDAFLVTARAWAETTQYPALMILEHVSRAAHHPGIADWLVELMREENAPWQSRVEAATALATRLRATNSAEAIVCLRQVVDDETMVIEHRLAAAEALSECDGERETSERGLRAVLADPAAAARECRNAALVLASFDGAARAFAVESLTALLDDPWTPEADLVEAANGLVEIGTEYHDRCAEVFRSVIAGIPDSVAAVEAVLGLASLGNDHVAAAVDAFTAAIAERRHSPAIRIRAALAYAKLGPQHRKAAAELVAAMASEFSPRPGDLQGIAAALADLGSRQEAVDLLRAVLSDQASSTNNRLWAARTLADLGIEYQVEAARFLRAVAAHSESMDFERASALARLAELGGPDGEPALATLRDLVADPTEFPLLRCEAATQLNRLGPEYHDEVAGHLLEIVASESDPRVQASALRALRKVGTRSRLRAGEQLLALFRPEAAQSWETHDGYWSWLLSDYDDRETAATTFTVMACDPGRKGDSRITAAHGLMDLGRVHHEAALAAVVDSLGGPDVPVNEVPWIAAVTSQFGARARARIATVVSDMAGRPDAAARVDRIAEALGRLGQQADPEITDALRHTVADDLVAAPQRINAAVALARAEPDELMTAVDLVFRLSHAGSVAAWREGITALGRLGADVVPRLRTVVADTDIGRGFREEAAMMIARNDPESRGAALTELRVQAHDEHLEFIWRTDAVMQLAGLDPDFGDDAVRFHRAVLDDGCQPVRDRCEAAVQLLELDQPRAQKAAAMLRHFATGGFSVEQRASGVHWLAWSGPFGSPEVGALAAALADHPEVTAETRASLTVRVAGSHSMVMKRALLADAAAPAKHRIGDVTTWQHPWLAPEAVAVAREAMAAPETSPTERADAAVALAGISPRYISEAVDFLEEMSTEHDYALQKLVDISPEARHRTFEQALAEVRTGPWARRRRAAGILTQLASEVSEAVADELRNLSADPRMSDSDKLEVLLALRGHDGLAPVRAMRDNPRLPAATRWLAADRLRTYDVADRAAGARVLHTIASGEHRIALRWRAARDLLAFGERGRELAVPILQTIVGDENLPVLARVAAARTLTTARPDLRVDLLRQLRALRTAENPWVRIRVLQAMGGIDAGEAARSLATMTKDRSLPQGARLRAATAMAALRRDFQEKAAIVAREVAHDGTAPWHIRLKAACGLARWSELCRAEAGELIRALTTQR